MKLFWKIFIAVFIAVAVVVVLISYITATRAISRAEKDIVDRHNVIVEFLAKEVEVGYLRSRWPFEALGRSSEGKDFLFWWIVTGDGTIHLADDASFIQTSAYDYFPQLVGTAKDGESFLNRDQNYGVLVKPLEIEEKKWSFWFGFSTKEILEIRKTALLTETGVSVFVLTTLGVLLFFIIRRFTKPILDLTKSADKISKGSLDERAEVKSKDEIGQLAESLNQMTESLIKSGEESKAITQTLPEPLFTLDKDGKITSVNETAVEMLGYEEQELIGKSIAEVIKAS